MPSLWWSSNLLTSKAFKQSRPHALRGIANSEFIQAINSLEAPNPVTVFIRKQPNNVDWLSDYCSKNDYWSRYNKNANKRISTAVKRALIDAGFIPEDMFPDVKIFKTLKFYKILNSIWHSVFHVKKTCSVNHLWYLIIYKYKSFFSYISNQLEYMLISWWKQISVEVW